MSQFTFITSLVGLFGALGILGLFLFYFESSSNRQQPAQRQQRRQSRPSHTADTHSSSLAQPDHYSSQSVGVTQRNVSSGAPPSRRAESERALPRKRLLRQFIQREVISRFRDHRERHQFAVLIFSPFEFSNISETIIRQVQEPGSTSNGFTSSTRVLFPAKQNFTNFIVAIPCDQDTGRIHSEELILDYGTLAEFCHLCRREGPVKTLLLYSWLMPCTHCTSKIIEEKEKLSGGQRMVVIYTADWAGENRSNSEYNRDLLMDNGIYIEKVPYNRSPEETIAPQQTYAVLPVEPNYMYYPWYNYYYY